MVRLVHPPEARLRRSQRSNNNQARGQRNSRARGNRPSREDAPPPPYSRLPPPNAENLETLRARNPRHERDYLRRTPYALPPEATLRESCRVAANNASYSTYAALFEDNRQMTAAEAIRAIADAVAVSPSYATFVAAVTMAESIALISAEEFHSGDRALFLRRHANARDAAVDAAEAAAAAPNACTWPCNVHRVDPPEYQADSDESSDNYRDTRPSP